MKTNTTDRFHTAAAREAALTAAKALRDQSKLVTEQANATEDLQAERELDVVAAELNSLGAKLERWLGI